jgi:hypothetical protein
MERMNEGMQKKMRKDSMAVNEAMEREAREGEGGVAVEKQTDEEGRMERE